MSVETAIIDGANEISDHERGVFRLSEIDELLGTEGTAALIAQAREGFSKRVQAELDQRCRTVLGQSPEGDVRASALDPSARPDEAASRGVEVPAKAANSAERRFGYARPRLH